MKQTTLWRGKRWWATNQPLSLIFPLGDVHISDTCSEGNVIFFAQAAPGWATHGRQSMASTTHSDSLVNKAKTVPGSTTGRRQLLPAQSLRTRTHRFPQCHSAAARTPRVAQPRRTGRHRAVFISFLQVSFPPCSIRNRTHATILFKNLWWWICYLPSFLINTSEFSDPKDSKRNELYYPTSSGITALTGMTHERERAETDKKGRDKLKRWPHVTRQ
jgi:hypothetical protein